MPLRKFKTVKRNQLGVDYKASIFNVDKTIFDLTNNTVLSCVFKRPGGVLITKTGILDGAANLGKLIYTNEDPESSILDEVGTWYFKFDITMSDNDFIPGDWIEFEVRE